MNRNPTCRKERAYERALNLLQEHHEPEFHYLIHLGMAFELSMAIRIKREISQKSAGLSAHMLVGFSANWLTRLDGIAEPQPLSATLEGVE